MAKRTVLTEGVINALRNLFFTAKASGKEDDVYANLVQLHPEVAEAWDELDKQMQKSLLWTYRYLKQKGMDTNDVEQHLKKLGVKYD